MLPHLRSLGGVDEQGNVGEATPAFPGGARTDRDSRFVLLKSRPAPSVAVVEPAPPAAATDTPRGDAATERRPGTGADHDQHKALRLLETVRDFIPQVVQENDLLRQNIFELKSQAEAQIEAAEQHAREWKTAAEASQAQIDTLEAMILELRSKLQRAESIAAVEQELSSKATREAAEAECLAKLFEDTVISSFGVGSMFQNALNRIGNDAKP